MSQEVVLVNLIKFVSLTESKISHELKLSFFQTSHPSKKLAILQQLTKYQSEFPEYFEKFKQKLEKGHCLGFSICHAVMDKAGKLEWWEAALKLVADWRDESLDELISLPGSAVATTRGKIFERVLNYIYLTQASPAQLFKLDGVNQDDILKPSSSTEVIRPVEYIDEKGSIATIQQNTVFSGTFTIDQLEQILKTNLRKNIICIVHSYVEQHAIRIGKQDDAYIIYDPNYSHTTSWLSWLNYSFHSNPIHKKFSTLKAMLKELVQIQGASLGIELASFNPDDVFDMQYFNSLFTKAPDLLIKKHGLAHIVDYNPTLLSQLIKLAEVDRAVRRELGLALSSSLPNNLTALTTIIFKMPDLLTPLVKLGINDSAFCENLADALAVERSRMGYAIFFLHCPVACLLQLIKLAGESNSICYELRYLIARKTTLDHGGVGLHFMTFRIPAAVAEIIKLAEESRLIRKTLGDILFVKNSYNMTVLDNIFSYLPEMMNSLVKLSENDKVFAEKLDKAIQASTKTTAESLQEYTNERDKLLLLQKQRPQNYSKFFKPALIVAGAAIVSATSYVANQMRTRG